MSPGREQRKKDGDVIRDKRDLRELLDELNMPDVPIFEIPNVGEAACDCEDEKDGEV